MKNKPKVYVGLSGGVDSAVSAALLKKQGYDVTGVFIKAWSPEGYVCTWKEDRRSAMRVAAVLEIPFVTLDLEKEYKKEVVDYMIAEYKKGGTPNPDVMCNKEIKFGYFLKFALENGADFVATGHYARVFPSPDQGEGRVGLMEAKDKNKDQSYFLWTLTQKQLKHILFPIGHLQKLEVRKLAKKFSLPQATRKDSQGLCFLGKVDMKAFLKEYIGAKKGDVLNEKGEKIGEHEGSTLYTIGERHGFTISKKSEQETPLYVVGKDIKKNTITVAPKITPHSKSQGEPLTLDNVNLINPTSLKLRGTKENLLCRIRYRQKKIGCRVEEIPLRQGYAGQVKVIFDEPQFGVSPGQSLVLYDKEICLGGGIIN